jgi:uncharacterized membrane protein
MNKSRLEAFSDGVFAIVITLLVLDIRPDVPGGTGWAMFVHAGPKILIYALSFILVGLYWVSHHNMLHFVEHTDRLFLWLNLLLLLVVAFIPYPAALLSSTHADTGSLCIYVATLSLANILGAAVWFHATKGHRLVSSRIPADFVRFVYIIHLAPVGVYFLAGLLAWQLKGVSLFLVALVPAFYVLPNPFIERRVRAAHAAIKKTEPHGSEAR